VKKPRGRDRNKTATRKLLLAARLSRGIGRRVVRLQLYRGMATGGAPADAALAALGYRFIPGPTNTPSDWVLRQTGIATSGFEWRGQSDYDAIGLAVVEWIRSRLTILCGLEEIREGVDPAVAFASPGWQEHTGPVLMLVCGSAPGGTAGVWGRSLCINTSTQEGTYPRRDI